MELHAPFFVDIERPAITGPDGDIYKEIIAIERQYGLPVSDPWPASVIPARAERQDVVVPPSGLVLNTPPSYKFHIELLSQSNTKYVGEWIEGAVAAALWDMADTAADAPRDAAYYSHHFLSRRCDMPSETRYCSLLQAAVEAGLGGRALHVADRYWPVELQAAVDAGLGGRPLVAGRDSLAVGAEAVANAILWGRPSFTMAEFYAKWEEENLGSPSEPVMRLNSMGFVVPNRTPYYSMADSMPMGRSLTNYADYMNTSTYRAHCGGPCDLRFDYDLPSIAVDSRGRVIAMDSGVPSSKIAAEYARRGMALPANFTDARGNMAMVHVIEGFASSTCGSAPCVVLTLGPFHVSPESRAHWIAPRWTGGHVAVDSRDRIIVTETQAGYVHVFDPNGTLEFRLGGHGPGPGSLLLPSSVAVDSDDRILVLTKGDSMVSAFSSNGTFEGTVVNASIFVSSVSKRSSTEPFAIAAGSGGNVVVFGKYYNNRQLFATYAPDGTLLQIFLAGRNEVKPDMMGLVFDPENVLVDSGGRIIAPSTPLGPFDSGKVVIYDRDGRFVEEFGDHGHGSRPEGIALDGDDRLYVSDRRFFRGNFLTLFELDRDPPAVHSVYHHRGAGGGESRQSGERVDAMVRFTEAVTVTGSPFLALAVGGGDGRQALYESGSGSPVLRFSYLVPPCESAPVLRYNGTGALHANGSEIIDGSGNAANLTLPAPGAPGSLSASREIRIGTGAAGECTAARDSPAAGDAAAHAAGYEDRTPPVVLSVSSPDADGAYGAGRTVNITVAFDEPAVVVVAGGAGAGEPLLALGVAAPAPRAAAYASGNGTDVLSFRYVVEDGDSAADLDYANSTALRLAGGAIADEAGNRVRLPVLPAPGAPGSLGHAKDIAIDTRSPPAVLSVSSPDADGAYGAGRTVNITVAFDEPAVVVVAGGGGAGAGEPLLALGVAAPAPRAAAYASGNGTDVLSFRYVVEDGDSAADLDYANSTALRLAGGAIADETGNRVRLPVLPAPGAPGSLGHAKDIAIDTRSPRILDAHLALFWYGPAVLVFFDEPVARPHGRGGWSISGADAAEFTVKAARFSGSHPARVALALSGHVDAAAPNMSLSYDPALGGVTDAAGNAAHPASSIDVKDRHPPQYRWYPSTSMTSDNTITVTYTEPVVYGNASAPPYHSLTLASGREHRNITGVSGNATDTHTVTFDGAPPRVGASATLHLHRLALSDMAEPPNRLFYSEIIAKDGRPTPPGIVSAEVTGPGTASVQYVRAPTTKGDYYGLVVDGQSRRGLFQSPHALMLDPSRSGSTVVFRFVPDDAPANATGSIRVNSLTIPGADGFSVLGMLQIPLADGQGPEIRSALVTGGNSVTVTYTEPVTAGPSAYSGLVLDPGGARPVAGVSGNATGAHTVAFGGAPAAPGAAGTITIDATAVHDMASPRPNRLGSSPSLEHPVLDGRTPAVVSAEVTGPDTAVIRYSVPVEARHSDYAQLAVGGLERAVLSLSGGDGGSDTHAIVFAPGGAPPDATGSVVINAPAVVGAGGAALGAAALAQPLADGQAPSIAAADAVSAAAIRVSFDEPVALAVGAAAAAGWSVSGGDSAGLSVAPGRASAGGPAALTLVLDGELPDTSPDGVALSYAPPPGAAAAVADLVGNALGAGPAVGVGDAIAPEIVSASVTAPGAVTVRYTEPVTAGPSAYSGLVLDPGGARPVAGVSGNATGAHTVAFDGAPAAPGAAGAITIDATAVHDMASPRPNRLGTASQSLVHPVLDGRTPAVVSAEVTGPDTAVIRYSVPVEARHSDYAQLAVGGLERAVLSLSGGGGDGGSGGSDTHAIVFAPGGAPPDATGSVVINAPAVVGAGGAALAQPLADGQAPSIAAADAVSAAAIRVSFDEPVALAGAAAGAAAAAGAGWYVSGGDSAGLSVAPGRASAGGPAALTLVLDGELPDTSPDGVALSYAPPPGAAAAVADLAGNALGAGPAVGVGDAIAPEIVSASVTAPGAVTVRYTEPVTAGPSAYSGLVLDPGGARPVAGVSGNATGAHTVAFGGAPAAPGAAGAITIDATAVHDMASPRPNRLGTASPSLMHPVLDGRTPAVVSAEVTGPDTAVIRYSVPVEARHSDYAQLAVGGLERAVLSLSGGGGDGGSGGSDTHAIVFAPGGAPPDATGSVVINAPAVVGAGGAALGAAALRSRSPTARRRRSPPPTPCRPPRYASPLTSPSPWPPPPAPGGTCRAETRQACPSPPAGPPRAAPPR